jgi:hypothetical protein
MATVQAVEPPIEDASGYRLTVRDLTFLARQADEVERWRAREAPLGMTVAHFSEMVSSLFDALRRDGIADADVRLKGSSVEFFAGTHKRMPSSRDEVFDLFVQLRRRIPTQAELALILSTLEEQWPSEVARPCQRPFDSIHRVGIDRYPSDYDVQISSDQIAKRVVDLLVDLDLEPTAMRVKSTAYSFLQKHLVAQACPLLRAWEMHRSDVLMREVTVAVFPSAGPPEVDTTTGVPSSHHRDSDWILAGILV